MSGKKRDELFRLVHSSSSDHQTATEDKKAGSYFALFEHGLTGKEYVLLGSTSDIDASAESTYGNTEKINGVLLLPVTGDTVVTSNLPIYVPYDTFMSSTGTSESKLLYRYKGRLYTSGLQDRNVIGGTLVSYTYIWKIDPIIRSKLKDSRNNADVPVSPCKVNGVYRHYKNGRLYQIKAIAIDHTHDDRKVVIYVSLRWDTSQLWVRDYEEFFAVVPLTDDTGGEGVQVQRFTYCYMGER